MVFMFGEINNVFIFAALNYGTAAICVDRPNRSQFWKGTMGYTISWAL